MQSRPENYFRILFWLVGLLYFATGLTALSYEVLWARILSTLFGVSIFGVVVTVSAFLAGLGLGSIAGRRVLFRIKNPLRIFAILELFVAIFAFNLPTVLTSLDALLNGLALDSYTSWISVQAIATFILMFIPAFALGFGFPMILACLKRSSINIGTIYALNTLGGVLGALFPLVLLPLAGWTVSVRLVAILAILAAVFAFAISVFLKQSELPNQNKN
ncbi:MAG: spermine synthase, partial [Gammaproteobacteria bacterium]|nr:spermine synthase [Gammaproteobacteria bacterium]